MRDPELVPLGCATVDPSYLPIAALNRIITQVTREMTTVGARYEGAPGLLTLRRQIARRAVEAGVALAEDDLCTTIGATEGAVARAARGRAARRRDRGRVAGVLRRAADDRGPRPARARDPGATRAPASMSTAFEETLRQQPVRALVRHADDARTRSARSCPTTSASGSSASRRRHDIPIIEDDVYGELVFDGSRPRPLRAFAGPSEDSHVLLVSSVSKTLAPGYRVGWIAGGRWHDQIVRLKYGQSLACPTLLGMAVAEFLASGGYDRHLRRLRAALAGNVERYREAIATEFPEGTRVSSPRGGFVLWVELPPGVDALAAPRAGAAPRHRRRARARCSRRASGSPTSSGSRRVRRGTNGLRPVFARLAGWPRRNEASDSGVRSPLDEGDEDRAGARGSHAARSS